MSGTTTLSRGVEVTAEGGPLLLVSLVLLASVLTVVCGLWIAVVVYRGYRRTGNRPTLFLAWGIVFLTAVQTTLRVVLDTAGAPLVATNAAAVASQILGLVLILYAIYGRPERESLRTRYVPAFLPPVAVLLAQPPALSGAEATIVAINVVAAGIGTFVAIQAGRAHRRHASRPMLYLGIGIALLTAVPFVFEASGLAARELAIVGVLLGRLSELLGLASVLYSLRA